MRKFPLLFLLLLFALSSCDSSKIYQRYEDLPNHQWSRDNTLVFEVDIEDAAPAYNVVLSVRHSTYYLWANLMVNLTMVYPSGEERTRDFDFYVKETDGSFKGEGAGDLWDIDFTMLDGHQFPATGKYTFKISNIMPIPVTDDVMQVGLILKKAQ